jgi:hypothetical protein
MKWPLLHIAKQSWLRTLDNLRNLFLTPRTEMFFQQLREAL